MNEIIKQNKVFAIAAIVVVIAGGYFWFMSGSGDSTGVLIDSTESGGPITQELFAATNKINAIKLDTGLFDDPVFDSLSDYSVSIPPQVPGRRNPFAPIGIN